MIEAPGSDVLVKLWTCVRNSQSSYFCPYHLYPHPKFRPPKWHVLHWIEENMKMQSQSSYMAKLSLVDVHFWTSGFIWHSSAELFASVQQLTIKSSAILSSIGIILYAHVLHRSFILSLRIASNNANSVLDSRRFWVSLGGGGGGGEVQKIFVQEKIVWNHLKPLVRSSFLGTRSSCLPSPWCTFFCRDDRKPKL